MIFFYFCPNTNVISKEINNVTVYFRGAAFVVSLLKVEIPFKWTFGLPDYKSDIIHSILNRTIDRYIKVYDYIFIQHFIQ